MLFQPDSLLLDSSQPMGVSQGRIRVAANVPPDSYQLAIDVAATTGGQTGHIPLNYTLLVDPALPSPTPLPTETPTPTPTPTATATPIPEELCPLTVQEGWMQPSQGVWQDDDFFADKPGRQLTRLGATAFRAELPMVLGRHTLLFGILRPAGEAALDRRNQIAIKGVSAGTGRVPVRFRFFVEENGAPAKEIYTSPVLEETLPLLGPCLPSRAFDLRLESSNGIPPARSPAEATAFTFTRTGPYRLVGEIVRADRQPPNDRTGIRVTVQGDVVETYGPTLHFYPVILSLATEAAQKRLQEESDFQADAAWLAVDDYFPLRPGALKVVKRELRDMRQIVQEVESGVLGWIKRLGGSAAVARRELLVAAINDRAALGTLLGAGERAVLVLRLGDMELLFPGAEGLAPSAKVIAILDISNSTTTGHELAHTLPYLWSKPQMESQCGHDWHNKPEAIAYGHRIQRFTLEERERYVAASTLMGDLVESGSPRWIARCTYWNLLNTLQRKADPELLLVRGALLLTDTLASGVLLPAYQLLGEADLESGNQGEWALALRDEDGSVLGRYPLDPQWAQATRPESQRSVLTFAHQIPYSPSVARVELIGPDQRLLDSLNVSASPPALTITHPLSGALLLPEEGVTVAWDGVDGDGDELLYSLFYSPDGGETWLDMAIEQSESSYPLALLPHSARQQVKVIVTDGVRSQTATVGFGVIQRIFLPVAQR